MTILNVVEYKEEGVVIIEDIVGRYAVTEQDPGPIDLEALTLMPRFRMQERDSMLT